MTRRLAWKSTATIHAAESSRIRVKNVWLLNAEMRAQTRRRGELTATNFVATIEIGRGRTG
jgi:hypothetical protein